MESIPYFVRRDCREAVCHCEEVWWLKDEDLPFWCCSSLMVSVFSSMRLIWERGKFERVCQEILVVHLRFEVLNSKWYQSAWFCDFSPSTVFNWLDISTDKVDVWFPLGVRYVNQSFPEKQSVLDRYICMCV